MKHYITKYVADGVHYAASWIQVNVFGHPFCFSVKSIILDQ